MDPIIGGALISGGASLLGSLFGSKSTNKANENNLRIARETNAMNARLFQKNLDYNSPSAQRARLKEAGLNPDLMYSGGASGLVNTNVPTMQQAAPMQSNADNIQNAFNAVGQTAQNAMLLSEQARALRIENDRKVDEDRYFRSLQRNQIVDPTTGERIDPSNLEEWKKAHPGIEPELQVLPKFRSKGSFDAFMRNMESVAQNEEYLTRVADTKLRRKVAESQYLDPEIRKAMAKMPLQEFKNLVKTASEIGSRINLNKANEELTVTEKEMLEWQKACEENSSIGAYLEKVTDPNVSIGDKFISLLGVLLSTIAGRTSVGISFGHKR